MVQLNHPGVYIQEVPSGAYTIGSVGTSVAAFVDFFREGPLNEPVEVFGMADVDRIFGGLDERSEGSYALVQYFLNGGDSAFVVRVASADVSHPLSLAGVILKADAEGGADVLDIRAASEGSWGNNLRVDVEHGTRSAGLFNLTVTRYDGPTAKAKPLGSERYLDLTLDSTAPRCAVKVINDQSKLIKVAAGAGVTATSRPAATGTVSGDLAALSIADFNGFSGKKISVAIGSLSAVDAQLGTWAAGTITKLAQLGPKLEAAIRAAKADSASYTGVTVEVVGTRLRLLSGKGKGTTTFSPTESITIANAGADTTATALSLVTPAHANVQQYPLGLTADVKALRKTTVGGDGLPPDATAIIGDPATFTGMQALERVDLFNILSIPRAVADGVPDTQTRAIYSAALALVERKRAFLLIDIPAGKNGVQEIKNWLEEHSEFRHKNSAVYFPRVQIPDPLNAPRLRSVASSGTLAGIYARTDRQQGVWKAPAGVEVALDGVVQLDAQLSDAESGVLNPLAINCLRTFAVYGNVAWGARTLVGADQMGSEWKYVNVRRLALMLEASVLRGTTWAVFEPNDEPLWASIRLSVGAYMNSLFLQGAFQGGSPQYAYFVKCDGETTSQNDRNQGIVNIQVGFAPWKPAEFIVIRVQQIAGASPPITG
nr:hypothetical protein [uncultured bacterium]